MIVVVVVVFVATVIVVVVVVGCGGYPNILTTTMVNRNEFWEET